MLISKKDKNLLRDLAKRVAEIASLPIMDERRQLWKRHNSLDPVRPMILVFPEGSWQELLPPAGLECEGEDAVPPPHWPGRFIFLAGARRMEWDLRSRIYYHEHLHDDTVIENEWVVNRAVTNTGWGLEPQYTPSSEAAGAWAFDPVINEPEDLKKLKHPEVIYDEEATQRSLEEARDIFGDILDVKLKGVSRVSFHLMSLYCRLRGLEQVMLDMYLNPGMLHDAMSFLEEGHRGLVRQYQELNLLSLNNDKTYHSSGGVGYSEELPQSDYDPDHIRPCDIWASAESQEMAQVSPELHNEFVLQYEKRLLEPFGLNGYGCCEALDRKLDYVFTIPHIRRISISPWADVEVCAQRLNGNYIYSWKPNPAHLVGAFDEEKLRGYIQLTLDVTKANGCVTEMILKDTHTCENQPQRFNRWTEIARELVESD
jgi:hypothetical protein